MKWPNEDNEIFSIEQRDQYGLVDGGELYFLRLEIVMFTICLFSAGPSLECVLSKVKMPDIMIGLSSQGFTGIWTVVHGPWIPYCNLQYFQMK